MEKIKFQAFGKVKRKIQSIQNDKELEKLYQRKENQDIDIETVEKEINNKLLEYQLK